MQFNMKIENNQLQIIFPYADGTKHLSVVLDKNTMTVIEPQKEVMKYSKDLEADGNFSLFMSKLWKLARAKEQKGK